MQDEVPVEAVHDVVDFQDARMDFGGHLQGALQGEMLLSKKQLQY